MTDLDIEVAFAKEIVKGVREWYHVCSSHVEHKHDRENEFPCIRFDIRDVIWKLDLPEQEQTQTIEDKLEERFWDQWNSDDYPKELEKELGFRPFFDLNGYRLLCNVRITDTALRLEEKQDELRCEEQSEEPSQGIIEDLQDEIYELQKEYIEQAKAIGEFLAWAPDWIAGWDRYYKEDMVLVIDDDDEYDYVDSLWYWDMKEDNGWRKVVKHKKGWRIIDERRHGNKTLQEVTA
jgi:hypothetical protein